MFIQGAIGSTFSLCVPLNSIKYDSFIVHIDKYHKAAKAKMQLEDTFHILVDHVVREEEGDDAQTVVKRKVIFTLHFVVVPGCKTLRLPGRGPSRSSACLNITENMEFQGACISKTTAIVQTFFVNKIRYDTSHSMPFSHPA